jgi:leader peptidase (prepilin peptidase)/N-methyltransferase
MRSVLMVIVLWGLLGALVAAGLNHLADRLPAHRALVPGPACPACGAPYGPRRWLALLALATRQARCSKCGAALAARRWLFEVGLGLAYGLLAWRWGLSWGLVAASFHAAALALVTVTDLETRIVPNAVVLPAAALTVLATALASPTDLRDLLLGGAFGFGLFFFLWAIYPKGMGFGDVKLAGYVGLIAGYPRVLHCLLVGILAGGAAAAVLLATRRVARRSYIPYAPFLVLGGALALFL